MSTIIVAGAGHGGLVAAIKTAKAGHDVTVFEKNEESACGYDQKDSFDASAMDYAGIEIPESYNAPGNEITFYPLDKDVEPITLPAPQGYRNITVERKELLRYLITLAKESGVKFHFGETVVSPVILGGRVSGIRTDDNTYYCDLVIDACGVDSPIRKQLPEYMCIDKETALYDCIYTYRASFGRVPGEPDPEHRYCIYVTNDTGFEWIITENDSVDVLIVRMDTLNYPIVADSLRRTNEENPHMDKNILRGGNLVKIPIRQPLAVFVADGYAAVGDSAFMTYSLKGSGIAYSIIAGTMLANVVSEDKNGIFSGATLWKYEKTFFKEIGFDACRIALVKNLLPYMTADEVSEIFRKKLITSDELRAVFSGDIKKLQLPAVIKDKLRILNELPEFRSQMKLLIGWFRKLTLTEPFLPDEYSLESAEKWAERYNKTFSSMIDNNQIDIMNIQP